VNTIFRTAITTFVAITMVSTVTLQARSKKHLDEAAALNLLLSTLKRDHVYDKRISLDCVTFETEEITRISFEFALREKHTAKCGGDPDTNPVIDRYRVSRVGGRIELYDGANDTWRPYNPVKGK
jgi:hypothetical protein